MMLIPTAYLLYGEFDPPPIAPLTVTAHLTNSAPSVTPYACHLNVDFLRLYFYGKFTFGFYLSLDY